jgi:D-serine deaminase-like pyridoxal phosphate-dependent protein
MGESAAQTLETVLTPCLVLDRGRVARNAQQMQTRAQHLGVALRPHMKTAKSVEVGRLLVGEGAAMATVSTLAEASAFLAAGFVDVLYGVGIPPLKLPEAARAARAGPGRLRLVVDTVEAAAAAAAFVAAHGPLFDVLVEIDSDGRRAGVMPGETELLLSIARELSGAGILAGVMTHAGGSYAAGDPSAIAQVAETERRAVVEAASLIRDAGLVCPIISVGSTPTVRFARHLEGVTEVRPGVFSLHDLYQVGLGVAALEDVAVTVLATVIGRSQTSGRVLLDAGFLALSRDRSTGDQQEDWGFGRILTLDGVEPMGDLMVARTNQEHGLVGSRQGRTDPLSLQLGQRVRILPNHACATAAGHDRYEVVDGDLVIVERWPRIAGWRA